MIPLVAPCITNQDREYIASSIALGVLTNEHEVQKYETMFAEHTNTKWAVAVNSGTNALTAALRALRWRQPTINIPSYTCTAVRNAVLEESRLTPHYIDTTYNIQNAAATLTDQADIVVHLFGRPTNNPTPAESFIEDVTLSLGAIKHLTGDLGVCSTHASKMISTGRGGIVFGDDPGLHQLVRQLVHYDTHTRPGFSFAMSATQAALGVSQLRQLDTFIARRQQLATRYTDAFTPAGIPCPDTDCGSVFFRYLISVDDPAQKVQELADQGIEAGRGVNPPLHQLAGIPDTQFPGTTTATNHLLSIPVHPSITDQQADHIIRSVLQTCAP